MKIGSLDRINAPTTMRIILAVFFFLSTVFGQMEFFNPPTNSDLIHPKFFSFSDSLVTRNNFEELGLASVKCSVSVDRLNAIVDILQNIDDSYKGAFNIEHNTESYLMEMSVDSNTFKFTPLLLQVDVLDSQKVPEETLDKVQACVWYYNFFVGIQPKFAQGIFSPNQELLSDPKYSKYRQDDDTLKFEYKNNDDICNYSAFDSKISGQFNFKGLRAKFNGELSENGNNTKTIKYFMEGVRNDSLTTTYLNISSGQFNSWNVVTSYDILLLKGWDHKKYAQMSVKFSNYRIK